MSTTTSRNYGGGRRKANQGVDLERASAFELRQAIRGCCVGLTIALDDMDEGDKTARQDADWMIERIHELTTALLSRVE